MSEDNKADLLEILEAYWIVLDQKADVSDDEFGGQMPNDAMAMLLRVEKQIERLEREAK